jgi:hypothetical protein
MPVLVRKNVVPAPCACTGCGAAETIAIAAIASHAPGTILKRGSIEFLPICFDRPVR